MVVAPTEKPNLRAYIAATFRGKEGRGRRRREEGKRRGERERKRWGSTGDRAKGEEYAGTTADAPPRAHFEPSARFNYKSYEVLDYSPRGN